MFKIVATITIVLCLLTVGHDANGILHIVIRYAIFGISFIGLYSALRIRKKAWLPLYTAIVILYNPFIPFRLESDAWSAFGFSAAVIFTVALVRYVKGYDIVKQADIPRREKAKKRPDREPNLWEKPRTRNELEKIRSYILSEVGRIELTDWGQYALKAIFARSREFTKLLIGNELDIEFIKKGEKNGITDAITSIEQTNLSGVSNLRQYFQRIFTNIYKATDYAAGNKFYWYGRDRVISMLRSYQVSSQKFVPATIGFYDVDGEELVFDKRIDIDAIKRLKEAIEQSKPEAADATTKNQLKGKYRFKIDSENPILEFDLEAIEKAGILKYEGSLVNSVYIDLKSVLSLCKACEYEGVWANCDPFCDVDASYFTFGAGHVMIAKYRGAVEYFPDRLYVEFQDIEPDSWIIRWLKSYKLHLEGND